VCGLCAVCVVCVQCVWSVCSVCGLCAVCVVCVQCVWSVCGLCAVCVVCVQCGAVWCGVLWTCRAALASVMLSAFCSKLVIHCFFLLRHRAAAALQTHTQLHTHSQRLAKNYKHRPWFTARNRLTTNDRKHQQPVSYVQLSSAHN